MKSKHQGQHDVVVVGAGPSGAVVSALLARRGYSVLVLEKARFPRFSIGESLLPQCMAFLEEAGMLDAVQAAGFQFKNGAAFSRDQQYDAFDFNDKFSDGWGTTFQVERSRFDKILADEAANQGAEIRYGHGVTALVREQCISTLDVECDEGNYRVSARFVLDASGFGRVLPRLLDLESRSSFPLRKSVFTHITDGIDDPQFDRNKILITVHPRHEDVWFWLIPFSDGRCSLGVVASREFFDQYEDTPEAILKALITQAGCLADRLQHAVFDTQVRTIEGYACNVSKLHGDGFALLGNAGEFLDPVFSSGVTIAMKSAVLAAGALDRELQGERVDWHIEYSLPLQKGVDTFRNFVEAWYDGRLQQVIFSPNKSPQIKRMISSVLAGYAWDLENPYVRDRSRLSTLAELCRTA